MSLNASHFLVAVVAGGIGAGAALLTSTRGEGAGSSVLVRDDLATSQIERRLEAIQRALESRSPSRSPSPAMVGIDADESPVPVPRANAQSPTADAPAVRREGTEREPLPTLNEDRLQEMQAFHESKEHRHEWMFATETRVLKTFGTPTSITSGADGEIWFYDFLRGDDRIDVMFRFNRGRLISIDR